MAEFTLKVQARHTGPKQFRWEIYREGVGLAVEQSREPLSESEAWEAGRRALERVEAREARREDVSQRAKRIVDQVTGDDD